MKKLILAAAFALYASTAMAAITGSAHDLTDGFTGSPFAATVGACTFCHAPHNSNTAVTGAPLWNRVSYTQAYQMYTSTTVNNVVGTAPGTNSLLCLACHDGTQAIAVVYANGTNQNVGGGNVDPILPANVNYVGTDLRNDHPVAIRYDNVVDPGLAAPVISGGLGSPATVGAFRLYWDGTAAYTVECGTCHDPHGIGTNPLFLRTANNTALCTTCHTNK